jgi:hypothetical protein
MRSGRTVEIPDQFTVTAENLTYEVGQGIQVSVQVVSIDIGRTEWANGEAPGSFAKRINQAPDQTQAPEPPKQSARRSITNSDLASYRTRRLQSEGAYEKRRVQLGLPSVAESRQRTAAESAQIRAEIRERVTADRNSEDYWRGRASDLRNEIATTDAQIAYVRNRLNELPDNSNPYIFGSPNPYGYNSPYGMGYPYPYDQRTVIRSTGGTTITLGQPGYPGQIYNGRRPYGRYGRNGRYGSVYGYGAPVYAPYQNYDYSYERSELTSQLDQLNRQRITLDVRWRQLEEDARRAGAYPGWLRP